MEVSVGNRAFLKSSSSNGLERTLLVRKEGGCAVSGNLNEGECELFVSIWQLKI